MAKTKTNTAVKNTAAPDSEVQALFEEIDMEVKNAQMQKFFASYGKYITALLVLVVIGTAGYSTMMTMRGQSQERDSERLITLLDKELNKVSPDEAKATILDLGKMATEGTGEGHRVAARLGEAGSLIQSGKIDEALASLRALHADASVKPLYRDYAHLLEIRARTDKDDANKLLEEMNPLLAVENPWHVSAWETSAVLYAKLGQKDKAVEQLNKIVIDPTSSSAVVERAKVLSRLYKAP
jgi:hypothetical protein